MTRPKLLSAAAVLVALAAAPSLAQARIHHHHHSHGRYYGLPYPISYLHNYGPGALPGTFAYYDGPSTNYCYQGSAAYIGQDGQRHPCF
ncbi:hypothetical protein SAMN05444159_6962 [Bradyrhizobium lablabi]|uniref:Uncharacterized protein n=1 Tax=Bradyrhizobium lablabi TaxID=722472 RepID=A0A1M7DXG9_9BRAD|nr:hypothetical protein [Bradyrhizobium lablabi]SHL84136.1 hypothetical protein SAMN05444159_6962 [Bradyrhizobium lablabi]